MTQRSIFPQASIDIIKARRQGKYLIPVQTQGSKIPFFAMAGLLRFYQLAAHIAKDQPFYCFEEVPAGDARSVAALYIREMKTVQPTGPYCVGGFCMWGEIAVEVVNQLEEQGEKVLLLVLVESYSPGAKLPLFSPRYIRQRTALFRKDLKLQHTQAMKLRFILNELNRPVSYLRKAVKNKLHTRNTQRTTACPAQLALFKASAPYWGMKNDAHMGWTKEFNCRVDSFVIQGDHMSILDEPAVIDFAGKLNSVLDHANAHVLRDPSFIFSAAHHGLTH